MATQPNLESLGNSLIAAGENQVQTGAKLKKAAQNLRKVAPRLAEEGQVHSSVDAVRQGCVDIRSLLAPVVTALQFIVNALNGFTVPTISATRRTLSIPGIGSIQVVIGVTVGSTNPLAQTATRVDTVRAKIADLRVQLLTISEALRDLRNGLPIMGVEIENAANDIEQSAVGIDAAGKTLKLAGARLGGTTPP